MNDISTKLTKLDLDTILNNYYKPDFWKQTWMIYEHENIGIIAKIHQINVQENKIYLELSFDTSDIKFPRLHKTAYMYYNAYYITIPIDNSDYKKEKFESDILLTSLDLLHMMEEMLIRDYNEFREATELMEKYKNYLEKIANEFLDKNNVTNEDIRQAYIDNYVSRCKIPNYESEVLKKMQYTVVPSEYLILISFFNDEKTYEEYSVKCRKLRKSTRLKLWADGKKLNSPEFVDKMKEKLEKI